MLSMLNGFSPIAAKNARVLILGSMPSETSLQKGQYYGHSRNSFWPIIEALFAASSELTYDQRVMLLKANGIALWDVVKTCRRIGSLDADIESNNLVENDFTRFFAVHGLVKAVFFNGRKAQQIYKKSILTTLPTRYDYLRYYCLPSTSPAYASMRYQQKLSAWQNIKQVCFNNEEL